MATSAHEIRGHGGGQGNGGVSRHRVIFIDLARALAVVFMLYGHAVSALLAPAYKTGTWFDAWQFQRGLTSCLFLLLAGFAFSVATVRHWVTHLRPSPVLLRRIRRFGFFVMLGYALHFPVHRWSQLFTTSEERWQSFFVVDVLQLIGVTFFGVQLLVLITRSRRLFTAVSLTLAVVLVTLTPFVWSLDWVRIVPAWMAAYFTPKTGSLFPLFPWSGYILVGVAAGQIYGRWGASDLGRYANWALIGPGAVAVLAGLAINPLQVQLFGNTQWSYVPPQFLVRTGACFLIMGAIAHGSTRLDRLPRVFAAVAQETLLIYFVHLCIVYGSIWNRGLAQIYGETLEPGPMLAVVVLLLAAMTVLAWYWHWCKHARPQWARWTMAAILASLAVRLL